MYVYHDPQALSGVAGETFEQQLAVAREAKVKQTTSAILRNYTATRTSELVNDGKNYFIENNLADQTLKVGTGGDWTWDTGIPLKPSVYAQLIGVGDQIGDSWRGIKQIMQENGVGDGLIDNRAQADNEQIMRHLYGDKYRGPQALSGAVVGAVAEPISALIPGGKLLAAEKLSTKVFAAMGVGALYGSTFYIDGNESRQNNAAITSVLVGTITGVAAKYIQHAVGDTMYKRTEEILAKEAKEEVPRATSSRKRKAGGGYVRQDTPEFRLRYDETGVPKDWFDEQVAGLGGGKFDPKATKGEKAKVDETGTSRDWFDEQVDSVRASAQEARKARQEARAKKPKKPKEDVAEKYEAKAAMEGGRHATVNSFWSLANSIFQPIADNIGKYSKIVGAKLRNSDAKQHLLAKEWSDKVKPWQTWVTDTLNKTQRATLKKLIHNGGLNKATLTFIRQTGGEVAVANAKAVQDTMTTVLQRLRSAGYKVNDTPDYFPLAVSDIRSLRKREQGVLDELYAKVQAKNGGKPLTASQKAHIDEHHFTFDQRYSNTLSNVKSRKKRSVADDELGFYHNPEDSLHFYIHTAAEDIAKREFFKEFGYKPGKDGLNPTGVDIDDSISSLVDTLKRDLSPEQQGEVTRLLRSRFSADIHKTFKSVQALKNLSYAGTLGNFWSAMTQFGDLVFAFHKYGIVNTVRALLGPKVSSRSQLGIEKAMSELNSETRGLTSRIADFAFKWSQFDRIDRFGKNVNINASIRANQKLARNNRQKFIDKWKNHFGDEVHELANEIADLKLTTHANMSDNAKMMLWNELADTQPIGLSEMPEKYLNMPNGRIFYAYKTFALKQMNYMRNMVMADTNAFRKGYNLTMFAAMFTLANSGIDGVKEALSGDWEDFNFEDQMWDNLATMAGSSKYAIERSNGLGGIILKALEPVPVIQAGKALDAATGSRLGFGDKADSFLNQLPVGGRMKKEWFD